MLVEVLPERAHWHRQAAFVVVSVDENYFMVSDGMKLRGDMYRALRVFADKIVEARTIEELACLLIESSLWGNRFSAVVNSDEDVSAWRSVRHRYDVFNELDSLLVLRKVNAFFEFEVLLLWLREQLSEFLDVGATVNSNCHYSPGYSILATLE